MTAPPRATAASRHPLVAAPVPGRLTLGTVGRQLLVAEPQHSVCVFGPDWLREDAPRVVRPALLEWPGPAAVTLGTLDFLFHGCSETPTSTG